VRLEEESATGAEALEAESLTIFLGCIPLLTAMLNKSQQTCTLNLEADSTAYAIRDGNGEDASLSLSASANASFPLPSSFMTGL
jgi:hypothetical protein